MASHCVLVFSLVGLLVAPATYASSVNFSSGSAMRANADGRGLKAKVGSGMRANVTGPGPASVNLHRGSALKAQAGAHGLNAKLGSGMRANVAGGGGGDPSSVSLSGGSAMSANAEGQRFMAKVGSGMRGRVRGGGGRVKVGMAHGMKADIGVVVGVQNQTSPPGGRRGLANALPKLFKSNGARFFQMLFSVVPAAEKLRKFIKSPAKANPAEVNKSLAELNATLNKMVEQKEIDREKAELLQKQTVKELKEALKGKQNVDLITTG